MKIDDFLKSKQVRFIGKDNRLDLTNGRVYDVIGVAHERIKVRTDNGGSGWYDMDCFELVIEPTEKPPQVAGSKFAAGEKVYFGTDPDIKIVSDVNNDNTVRFFGEFGWVSGDCCCSATQENYEKLCSLFECIDFEQPPQPLTGSDLTRAMVDKGWFIVDCYVSAISDEDALRFRNKRMQVTFFSDGLFTDGIKQFPFAVPFDAKTGNPLTERVLDE